MTAQRADSPLTWSLVVPVKVLARAKSRLAVLAGPHRPALALAMAADTVAAALACPAVDRVIAGPGQTVAVLGLSFKMNTDDLRESPNVDLAERLIGKGYDLRIYDPSIHLPSLTGTNREYIEEHLPHLKQLLADTAGEVVEHAETCIVASRHEEVGRALESAAGRMIIDLVRLPDTTDLERKAEYHGVAW